MFWWLNKPREAGWSLSRRLMSRIIVISTFITVLVTASVTAHYGYDIPELQQRTVFGLAQDVARDMPYDGTGDEMRETVNTKHDLFTRYPNAYEWFVLNGDGDVIASSAHGTVDRKLFPPGLPPPEWDAPTLKGGWMAGKTFIKDGHVRHVITASHSDPGGLWSASRLAKR